MCYLYRIINKGIGKVVEISIVELIKLKEEIGSQIEQWLYWGYITSTTQTTLYIPLIQTWLLRKKNNDNEVPTKTILLLQ